VLATGAGVFVTVGGAQAGAASVRGFTWPEWHNSPSLTGVSADPTITTANASTLGVKWMEPLAPALDSPMVGYDAAAGRKLAFVGGKDGFFEAVSVSTGAIVWSDYLGATITSSPLVENGNVWIAPTGAGIVYKLDAATGATECTASITGAAESSPVIATPPGGVTTVYFGALDSGGGNGPVAAYAESNCAALWQWSSYVNDGTGTWTPLSYGLDASGVGLVVFGSSDPDSTEYALNATTGALVWHYATYSSPGQDWDIGAGADISAPGVNGFADGMAYVEGKDGILYALDLTTGALVWTYNFSGNGPGNPAKKTDALSTPALSGTTLVFGDASGLYAVDARNGQERWFLQGTGVILSSPAIVGPSGSRVVAYGDLSGYFHVVSLSTGAPLYQYKTGAFITSSPADVDGTLLIASDDGFLYDFGLGGGSGSVPTTTITSPAAGATFPNPSGGHITISGTATASDGVRSVSVLVQMNGAAGQWYHSALKKFAPGLGIAQAKLASPGATSTTWSLALPVPEQAAAYVALASAVGANGVADGTLYQGATNEDAVGFDVAASPSAPTVSVTPPRVSPGGQVSVTATKFAPNETVTFTATVSSGATVRLASVSADAAGSTSATVVTIPSDTLFGPDAITATGGTSADVGAGFVYVANDSPQFGYGPLHQGFEQPPGDMVIAKNQGVTTKVVLGWTYSGHGAFDTTPAIDNGIVYSGDEAGSFAAVSETSGAPVFTLDDGSPIESSPAVDAGSVFFGDDGGNVRALNASTGTSVWSANVGGHVGSPAVAGGRVYVGTSNGSLVALDQSTGSVDWTDSIAGSVVAAPAVDTAAGIVIVTSSTGVVQAVAAATGKTEWSRSVGGAVTGAMIDAGTVFAGSSAGSAFGLVETTGATRWSASVGSAIAAAPIMAFNTDVAFGDASGKLSYFAPANGSSRGTQNQFGHAITGLSFTGSIIMMTSSSGDLGLIQGSHFLLMSWKYHASAGYASPGVLLNGDMFVLGGDGVLRAFTTPDRTVA
jgi:outer membrane protein assembly factor BamB